MLYFSVGEVSEWLKVPLSKSGVVMSHRGFESHPLRHVAFGLWLLAVGFRLGK